MIDQVDARLKTWVQDRLPEAAVRFQIPPDGNADVPGDDDLVVSLYLVRVVPSLAGANLTTQAGQLLASYLVTVQASDPLVAHRALGELAFAAMDEPDFELDYEPPSAELWLALKALPQPAIVIRATVRRERAQPLTPLVRVPLVVERAPMTSLRGVVLGPDDFPLQGVRVMVSGLSLNQITNAAGQFYFPTLPQLAKQTLRIRAKGREFEVAVEPQTTDDPVVIRLDLLERET